MLSFEEIEPSSHRCDCCDGTTTQYGHYVYESDDAYGVCMLRLSDNHPDRSVFGVVSLGGWGGAPSEKLAFCIEIRNTPTGPGVRVFDAAASPWHADSKRLGRMLSREESLAHSRLPEVFAITDKLMAEDKLLIQYLANQAEN